MATETLKEAISLAYTEVEPCVTKVDLTIPKAAIDAELKETIKEFVGLIQIPGFRKGKAPVSLVKKRFKKEIDSEILKRFYMTGYEKITEEKKVDILTYPAQEDKPAELKLDEDYTFEMKFNTAPEFELPEYKGIEVETEASEIDKDAIEKQLDYYRGVYAEYKTVETPAEAGDMLKVSYTSDFETTEETPVSLKRQVESDENWLWLQDPETLPGCVEALTGAEKDKEYDLKAEYAADYREADLAGKTVNYKIKVIEVQRKEPITDDTALAKKMNLDSAEALNDQVKNHIEAEAKAKSENETRQKVTEQLVDTVAEFPFPPAILEGEKLKELRNIANRVIKSHEDADKFKEEKDKYDKEAQEAAEKRLKQFFIFRKIADSEGIEVDSSEVDQSIKSMSAIYGMKEQQLKDLMHQNGGLEDLHIDMLMSKVAGFLVENATVKEAKKKKAAPKKKKTEEAPEA